MIIFISACSTKKLPELDLKLENARVKTQNDKLIISTGKLERTYVFNSYGFLTIGLKNELTGTQWINADNNLKCDWGIDKDCYGNLISLNARISDDEKFTNHHICVEADIEYPEKELIIKYVVWVYPNIQGIRTQLQLKALPGFDNQKELFKPDITETLLLKEVPSDITAFGYMQGIKTNMDVDILSEKKVESKNQNIDWANGLIFSGQNEGIILVKESNKHTHLKESGNVATGKFIIDRKTLKITGAGMYPKNLCMDKFLSSWANWLVLFSGGKEEATMALKKFDRMRYPVHPGRDIFVMANTWGTEDKRPPCLYAAREENVLTELESVEDLGIDILQIDDGWQTKEWLPASHSGEYQRSDVIGNYAIYPEGWENVKKKAKKLNIKLGLWAAWTIPLEKLKYNYDQGEFNAFKLDFANLNTIEKRDNLMEKARELIKHSNYNTCVNWDVTETPPRAGFFYGREYGNIYLENRKINTARPSVQYVPYKVLKDAWHLSKYINLNKFQVTVQNIDMVKDPSQTDAGQYNHYYVIGITLMSSPIFFQETRHYSEKARSQIRSLLNVYKKHRDAIYAGYVFPIGDEPDNRSWTGFQNHNPESESGYLTIFRELHNKEKEKKIDLKFLKNKKILLQNVLTGEKKIITQAESSLSFSAEHPASFQFYRYNILE